MTTTATSVSPTGEMGTSKIFYSLLLPALVLWYIYWKISRRHMEKLAAKIPGLPGYPVIGNALEFINLTSADIFKKAWNLSFQFGNIVKIWFGPKLVIVVMDPSDVELILNSHVHIDKAPEYSFFKPWLGDGLLISTGNKWKAHRKLIAPTFHLNVLKSFVDLFNANSRQVVQKLNEEIGKEFDVHDYMSEATVEILLGKFFTTLKF